MRRWFRDRYCPGRGRLRVDVPAPILNSERIERAIEQATLTQRNKRVNVSCPSGVLQKKGVVFTCTAAYKGGSGSFIVTETDGTGRVHYLAK